MAEGEGNISSLQREVDRLTLLLSKAQEAETVQKERALALSQDLQEATAAHSVTQGRLGALQKTLGQTENERRQLQVSRQTDGQYGRKSECVDVWLLSGVCRRTQIIRV